MSHGKRKQDTAFVPLAKHARDKLSQRSSSTASQPLLNSLPSELLRMIFLYFSPRPLLLVISFVCKRWRVASLRCFELLPPSAISSAPSSRMSQLVSLFSCVTDLRITRHPGLLTPALPAVLRSLTLDVNAGEHGSPAMFCLEKHFADHVSALTTLNVRERWNCTNLTTLITSCQSTLTDLTVAFYGRDEGEDEEVPGVHTKWFTETHLPVLERLRVMVGENVATPRALARFLSTHQGQLKMLQFTCEECEGFLDELRVLNPPLHFPILTRLAPYVNEETPLPLIKYLVDCAPALRQLDLRVLGEEWIEICNTSPNVPPLLSTLLLQSDPPEPVKLDLAPHLSHFSVPTDSAEWEKWPYPPHYSFLTNIGIYNCRQFLLAIAQGAVFPRLHQLSIEDTDEVANLPALPVSSFPKLRTFVWTASELQKFDPIVTVLEWVLSSAPGLQVFEVCVPRIRTAAELERFRALMQRAERNGVLVSNANYDMSAEMAEHRRKFHKFLRAVRCGQSASLQLATDGMYSQVKAMQQEFKWMKLFVRIEPSWDDGESDDSSASAAPPVALDEDGLKVEGAVLPKDDPSSESSDYHTPAAFREYTRRYGDRDRILGL